MENKIQEQKQIALEELRKQINIVDTLLINCLAKRQEIVKIIAGIKKKENLPVFRPEREQKLLEERKKLASSLDLDLNFVENIFREILINSKKEQARGCRYR